MEGGEWRRDRGGRDGGREGGVRNEGDEGREGVERKAQVERAKGDVEIR